MNTCHRGSIASPRTVADWSAVRDGHVEAQMLKITASVGSEVVSANEVSAKMLSFLRKGQVTLSDEAGDLKGCRACAVTVLLDPGMMEVLSAPTVVFVGADGARSDALRVHDLEHTYIAYSLPNGQTLPPELGGPLCVLIRDGQTRGQSGGPTRLANVAELHLRSPAAGAQMSSASELSSTVRLDEGEVRRGLEGQQEAAMAATALADTREAVAAAPADRAAIEEWTRLKAEALEAIEAERRAAATREMDRFRDIEKGIGPVAAGMAALVVIVAVVAALLRG